MITRIVVSLWPFWWRALVLFIGIPCLLVLCIEPPSVLYTVIGVEIFLLLWRRNWLCRFSRHVWRFRSQPSARLILHYSSRLKDHIDSQPLVQQYESQVDQIAAWFGFAPRRRVAVFLLDNRAAVRAVFGKSARGLALTIADVIIIAADAKPDETIRHELVHLFSARWNTAACPLFKEGLAVWLQGTVDGVPVDSMVRPLLKNPHLRLSKLLNRQFFFADAHRDSCYVLAGSFAGFLIRRFGFYTFRAFYRKTHALKFQRYFRNVFGITFEDAEREWRAQLQADGQPLGERLRQKQILENWQGAGTGTGRERATFRDPERRHSS
jgi:hypothetical protein